MKLNEILIVHEVLLNLDDTFSKDFFESCEMV